MTEEESRAYHAAYYVRNKDRKKLYRENNKDKIRQTMALYDKNRAEKKKAYREAHKQEIRAQQRAYDIKHWIEKKVYRDERKEERVIYDVNYYAVNADKIRKNKILYNETHKEERKLYRETHKKERAESRREWERKRLLEDPNFLLMKRLRNRIRAAIKSCGATKSSGTANLVACSLDFLKEHLQKTALNNGYIDFDINNYSGNEYHIDHITPCVGFYLVCSYHQKMCFHWSNLQILRKEDNIRKRGVMDI